MMNDLLFTQGNDNLSGIVGELYITASENIITPPVLALATSLKTSAVDMVMDTGKMFKRIYITAETGKVDTNGVGERDGKGRETILSGRFPAMGVELEDAIRQYQNTPSVLMYRLARNGKLYMLGISQLDITSTALSLAIPAYFDQGAGSSGDVRSAQNGALLSWKYSAAHGPIEYAGAGGIAALLVAGA
jgi:hypothetical protein